MPWLRKCVFMGPYIQSYKPVTVHWLQYNTSRKRLYTLAKLPLSRNNKMRTQFFRTIIGKGKNDKFDRFLVKLPFNLDRDAKVPQT